MGFATILILYVSPSFLACGFVLVGLCILTFAGCSWFSDINISIGKLSTVTLYGVLKFLCGNEEILTFGQYYLMKLQIVVGEN